MISSLILPEKSFNPLHNPLPDFFNCHLKNGHNNELSYFPNRRFDFSLLGSLSAATKLPKALLYFLHIKNKIYHGDVTMVRMQK